MARRMHLGQPSRWWVLAEDAGLVALAVSVHRRATSGLQVRSGAAMKEVGRP